ncbi:MAG: hypothetical protein JW900_04525 [Anaerolineae bacterium]|nr:hypothetical protein [Anaerolineae bacterium]
MADHEREPSLLGDGRRRAGREPVVAAGVEVVWGAAVDTGGGREVDVGGE